MNKAESWQLARDLEQIGYEPSKTPENADIVVLNSCVVRQSAENRVVNKLNSLKSLKKKKPDSNLVLAGCMVDSKTDELEQRFPQVDIFLKPASLNDLVEMAKSRSSSQTVPTPPPVSAFVTIIQGCDNFCSYCIVPYRRGREKSRPLEEIVFEVQKLVQEGAKEVVLLGQNVDSYGNDLSEKIDLAGLLEELNRTEKLKRIRFLTNHPKDMTRRLVEATAHLDKVCEYINVAIQSGNDEILGAMRRGYTVKQYLELIEHIRESIPDVGLSTDVIVGFPGETETQFEDTLNLIKEVRFDTVHVAAYSERSGTIAARKLKDDVPFAEKMRRLHRIEEVQERISAEINAKFLGRKVEILVEGRRGGKWYGRMRNGKLVFFRNDTDLLGQLVEIQVENASTWSLRGSFRNMLS